MENIQFEEWSYLFHLYLIMDPCAIKQREKPECFSRPVGFTVKKVILCILKQWGALQTSVFKTLILYV